MPNPHAPAPAYPPAQSLLEVCGRPSDQHGVLSLRQLEEGAEFVEYVYGCSPATETFDKRCCYFLGKLGYLQGESDRDNTLREPFSYSVGWHQERHDLEVAVLALTRMTGRGA